jgi:hypothetical protein
VFVIKSSCKFYEAHGDIWYPKAPHLPPLGKVRFLTWFIKVAAILWCFIDFKNNLLGFLFLQLPWDFFFH